MSLPQLLSHALGPQTPGFGGKAEFHLNVVKAMAKGDSCNQTSMQFSSHLGTHVDAPFHFCEGGRKVTDFPSDHWLCHQITLLDIPIDAPGFLIDLSLFAKSISEKSDFVIIRTGFERWRQQDKYWSENPGFLAKGGDWLRTHRPRVKFIGFDSISLTSFLHREEGRLAHRAFLDDKREGQPVMIIEDMALANLQTVPKRVLISPLFIEGAEGSPVTVWAE